MLTATTSDTAFIFQKAFGTTISRVRLIWVTV